jgi:hypothetical protein
VLNRWYSRAPADFARIYNRAMLQDLSVSKVRNQYEHHVRLHGPDAFSVYKAVISVPFDDPQNVYGPIRNMIEATALKLGIKLYRLGEELTSPSGKARRAKSAKTRKLYKSLVRRTSQEEQANAIRTRMMEALLVLAPPLGSVALKVNGDFEASEYLVDTEDDFNLAVQRTMPTSPIADTEPKLGFRVWSPKTSRTKLTDDGFISEAFLIWRGPFPKPFDPQCSNGKLAIDLLCNLHFSMNAGGASACKETQLRCQQYTF